MKDKGPGSRVKNEGSVARNELYPSMLNTDQVLGFRESG